mgnify:CR=1 FL=1
MVGIFVADHHGNRRRRTARKERLPDSLKARRFVDRKAGAYQKRNVGYVLPWVLKCGYAAVRQRLEAGFGVKLAELRFDRARNRLRLRPIHSHARLAGG